MHGSHWCLYSDAHVTELLYKLSGLKTKCVRNLTCCHGPEHLLIDNHTPYLNCDIGQNRQVASSGLYSGKRNTSSNVSYNIKGTLRLYQFSSSTLVLLAARDNTGHLSRSTRRSERRLTSVGGLCMHQSAKGQSVLLPLPPQSCQRPQPAALLVLIAYVPLQG